jgi:hypothetical protein
MKLETSQQNQEGRLDYISMLRQDFLPPQCWISWETCSKLKSSTNVHSKQLNLICMKDMLDTWIYVRYRDHIREGKSAVKVQPEIHYIALLQRCTYLNRTSVMFLFLWRMRHGTTLFRLLIFAFLKPVFDCSYLICSFCDTISGSLAVVETAVTSENVAVVDSGKVVRSAICSRHSYGITSMPWNPPKLFVENSL